MATTRRKILIALMLITSLLPPSISWRRPKLEPATIIEPEFKEGDLIPLFADKVFRSSDGCEAQSYFDLPFCSPDDSVTNRKKTLEEILKGDCLTTSQYQLKFKVETVGKILCERNLTIDEVKKFRLAISKSFEYHMYYNNILLREVVGFVIKKSSIIDARDMYFLFKHIDFYPHYYESQVVDIYSSPDVESAVDVTEDAETRVKFTYSVFWKDSKIYPTKSVSRNETAKRKYSEKEGRNRWTDSLVFWAAMLCIWLWVLVEPIAAYLQNYFPRCPPTNVTEFVVDGIPHQIHGDICWRPPYSSLLGSILAIGSQQLITICFLFALFYKGVLYACDFGQLCLNKYVVTLYCVTYVTSGRTALLFHSQYSAQGREECIFQTATLFFVPVFLTVVVVNIAVTPMFADLPELAFPLEILITWGFGSCFFIALGGASENWQHEPQELCTTRRTQNVIPWWQSTLMSTPAQMFLGGLFPFLSLLIFRDMDQLYASLLLRKVCGAFSALLSSFILVIIMTIVMAVLLTYYQLSKEDFNWMWRSVFRGGSTAIFIFAYGINFQYRVEHNYGALFVFMCYNACFCYALFLVLGTVSFFASSYVDDSMNPGLHRRE